MKINKLEIENTKRVKAVVIEPTADGLTIIGGNNNQGKTSVLDAIAWALGGNKFKPSNPHREGSTIPPALKITMSNGLVVERKGANSDLKIIDPTGRKAGQKLLDTFVEELALDLPKFMDSNSKDKARTLLQIIGVGDQLYELEQVEKEKFSERTQIGKIASQKEKYAAEQAYFEGVPSDLVSASDLIKQQQDILQGNAENNRKRQNLEHHESLARNIDAKIADLMEQKRLNDKDLEIARKSALDLHDESTEELETSINEVDDINRKVRANLDRDHALEEAVKYKEQYDLLTESIENIRAEKLSLLDDAKLPLPDLGVEDGELTYKGFKWDAMSGSEQLKVSTAIVRELNPECKFVLIDKLEQMDQVQLKEFGDWLKEEKLQAIATRVSTGEECTLVIEDGYVLGQENILFEQVKPKWEAGKF